MSRALIAGAAAAALALAAPSVRRRRPCGSPGQNVAEVRLFRDGRPVDEPSLVDFIETRPGRPLSMRQVRESLTHLFSLGEFVDVRASAAAVAQGVSLRYDLVPFRGAGGMEVLDPRGRPVEEAADLVRRRLGKQGGARSNSPPPRPSSISTIATRAGSRRASRRGRRRRMVGSSSTSTPARRRASRASRSAGSSPPSGPSS